MTLDDFINLHRERQWAMVIAQDVHSTLGQFLEGAAINLPEPDVTELNRRIRHGILMTVHTLMNAEKPGCQYGLDYRVLNIPDEWETPELLPEETELLDVGYTEEKRAAYEKSDARREAWFRTGEMDGE